MGSEAQVELYLRRDECQRLELNSNATILCVCMIMCDLSYLSTSLLLLVSYLVPVVTFILP